MIKLICVVVIAILSVSTAMAQVYGLEELTENADKNVASINLQIFMQNAVKRDLQDCSSELHLTKRQRNMYFSSVTIPLDTHNRRSFLVFPSRDCGAFFGAHAVAYWIVSEDTSNKYRMLYKGMSDFVEIMQTSSYRKKCLRSFYGVTYIILKFDGKKYKRAGHGNGLWE
ncbi:hypothetical protein [Candidatus Electronema sp. JM]|uniref:hypothetical protein n=1 Tax=Candidatus Electronema sp. JM TaxID=3401571 RepID=UPI003AA99A06